MLPLFVLKPVNYNCVLVARDTVEIITAFTIMCMCLCFLFFNLDYVFIFKEIELCVC